MVRVGKWDEQKILFKNRGVGGHDHAGGTRGAHLTSLAMATGALTPKSLGTGCIQYVASAQIYSTAVKKRLMFCGTITKVGGAATIVTVNFGGATGWSIIDWARVNARSGFGTTAGGAEGTVDLNNFNAATLFLSATLGVETKQVHILAFGA